MQLGIDLGGTKTALGVVNTNGEIEKRHSFPTSNKGFETYFRDLLVAIDLIRAGQKIEKIGIGCAGQIELGTGLIHHSPNLGWVSAPLGSLLKEHYKIESVSVDNDVRASTLGEYLFGLEKRPSSYVNVFLGTGIGSGIILSDTMIRGYTNSAGEIGQTSINCDGPKGPGGNHGVWEYYASGSALTRMGQEWAQSVWQDQTQPFRNLEGVRSVEDVTGKMIGNLALSGNVTAQNIVARAGHYLGIGLANLINLINPEVITYGGGMADLGEILIRPMLQTARERSIRTAYAKTKIIPVRLGNDAAIIGSAFLHRLTPSGQIL